MVMVLRGDVGDTRVAAVAHVAGPDLDQAVVETLTAADLVERRVVAATLACVARFGLSKMTIDDVAREAGCARATLYRYVGGKRQIVNTTIAAEVDRLATHVWALTTDAADLEDAVVAIVTYLARDLADHDAVQFLLAFEPELILPHLTFDRGDRFLAHAVRLLAPALERFLPPERAARAAEWITRVLLTYVCSPDSEVSMTDDTDVRALVRAFVLPGLVGESPEPVKGEIR